MRAPFHMLRAWIAGISATALLALVLVTPAAAATGYDGEAAFIQARDNASAPTPVVSWCEQNPTTAAEFTALVSTPANESNDPNWHTICLPSAQFTEPITINRSVIIKLDYWNSYFAALVTIAPGAHVQLVEGTVTFAHGLRVPPTASLVVWDDVRLTAFGGNVEGVTPEGWAQATIGGSSVTGFGDVVLRGGTIAVTSNSKGSPESRDIAIGATRLGPAGGSVTVWDGTIMLRTHSGVHLGGPNVDVTIHGGDIETIRQFYESIGPASIGAFDGQAAGDILMTAGNLRAGSASVNIGGFLPGGDVRILGGTVQASGSGHAISAMPGAGGGEVEIGAGAVLTSGYTYGGVFSPAIAKTTIAGSVKITEQQLIAPAPASDGSPRFVITETGSISGTGTIVGESGGQGVIQNDGMITAPVAPSGVRVTHNSYDVIFSAPGSSTTHRVYAPNFYAVALAAPSIPGVVAWRTTSGASLEPQTSLATHAVGDRTAGTTVVAVTAVAGTLQVAVAPIVQAGVATPVTVTRTPTDGQSLTGTDNGATLTVTNAAGDTVLSPTDGTIMLTTPGLYTVTATSTAAWFPDLIGSAEFEVIDLTPASIVLTPSALVTAAGSTITVSWVVKNAAGDVLTDVPVELYSTTPSDIINGTTVQLVNPGNHRLVARVAGLNVSHQVDVTATQVPQFTSTTMATPEINVAYTELIPATGYPAPTFAVTSGALPSGLRVDGDRIVGTATGPGPYAFTITATNTAGATAQAFSGRILPDPAGADAAATSAGSSAAADSTSAAAGASSESDSTSAAGSSSDSDGDGPSADSDSTAGPSADSTSDSDSDDADGTATAADSTATGDSAGASEGSADADPPSADADSAADADRTATSAGSTAAGTATATGNADGTATAAGSTAVADSTGASDGSVDGSDADADGTADAAGSGSDAAAASDAGADGDAGTATADGIGTAGGTPTPTSPPATSPPTPPVASPGPSTPAATDPLATTGSAGAVGAILLAILFVGIGGLALRRKPRA